MMSYTYQEKNLSNKQKCGLSAWVSHLIIYYVYSETDMGMIEQAIEEINPDFVIIDSIQTVFHPDVTSAPGSVSQVRECTAELMRLAKTKGIAIFIVGHVTKEGQYCWSAIIGAYGGYRSYILKENGIIHYRILRAVKNSFGSTNEMGIFEMKEEGLGRGHESLRNIS